MNRVSIGKGMKVSGINHINIVVTSAQLPDVVAFYEHVIGLKQGLRAHSQHNGAWLYCNSTAIIHLSVVEESLYAGSNTHFNHAALACSGVDECLKTLEHYSIHYKVEFKAVPEMTQIFVFDPVGIRLELNFAGEKIVQ
jgi:catechol 2,3-dioxygenase-like lactoylglutathione lyase family enzyme